MLGVWTIKLCKLELDFVKTTFKIKSVADKMAFMNQLSRRSLSSSHAFGAKIQEFIVIGGGLMGAGIAQVYDFINIFKIFHSGRIIFMKGWRVYFMKGGRGGVYIS